jgi:hypothetical protein
MADYRIEELTKEIQRLRWEKGIIKERVLVSCVKQPFGDKLTHVCLAIHFTSIFPK